MFKQIFQNNQKKLILAGVLGSIGIAGTIITSNLYIGGLCPVNTWFKEKAKITKDELTIGMFSPPVNFQPLINYLRCNLDNVTINLVGDNKYSYQEARNQLALKNWDIGFLSSPMVAVSAKDNGYTFLTRTHPDKDRYYHSAIFALNTSPLESINDINENTTIALSNINSTATFYMPVYDLYGVKANIDIGVDSIPQKVRDGEYDVGTAVYNTIKDNSEFKILAKSRPIPGGGVYISPTFNEQDKETIKQVFLSAPQHIQTLANYGSGNNPQEDVENDYTEFKKITNRVQEVLVCTDFDAPLVLLFCGQAPTVTVGQLKSYKIIDNDKLDYLMSSNDGKFYSLIVSKSILENFTKNFDDLINSNIKVYGVNPVKKDNKLELIITNDKELIIN